MSNPRNPSPNSDSGQSMAVPSGDAIKTKSKQMLGEAKLLWGQLTDDEQLQFEGHAEELTGPLHQHYALTREGTALQVKTFPRPSTSPELLMTPAIW